MKKAVIVLLFIILFFSIILIYKITSSTNKDISVADKNNNQEEIYDIYTKYNITEPENQTIVKDQTTSNNNNKYVQSEVYTKPIPNINQSTQTEANVNQIPEKKQQHIQNSINSGSTNNKTSVNSSNDNYYKKPETTTNSSNISKEDINTDVDAKSDYVVQLTTRVKNTFKGYGNNNIYWLESGAAFIQTDFTRERETLSKPQAELRYYVKTQQFKLYIDGMSTDVEVASLNVRKGNVVFPQQEYSKYNQIVQSLAGSGSINSSSTKPYFDKLDDIKNNWTKLCQGRVVCISGTSYWEQIDSSVGTFEENAEVIVGSYNGKDYMLIDGIVNSILVKSYKF